MADYDFLTTWELPAPVERVWAEIHGSEAWPSWWRAVESVRTVREGGEHGLGGIHHYVWRGKLPYRLSFDMEVTRVEPMALLEGVATGELDGIGTWRFGATPTGTRVDYTWRVKTTKIWMNLMYPVARPFFAWNHDVIMAWGLEGLAARLRG